MQISVNKADMRVEGDKLIITINSDLEKILGLGKVPLSSVKPGTVIGGDFIVARHITEDVTEVWSKELIEKNMRFGSTNDWRDGPIRKFLNGDYLAKLEKKFGTENIIPHRVDLRSLDGLRDYGECFDKVAIPTLDEYRDSREVLGKKLDNGYWLATPDSTSSGYCADFVQYVSSDGSVRCSSCVCDGGVRCVLYLESSILVSTE